MALSQLLLGAPTRLETVQKFNPQQQNALQSILSLGLQNLQHPSMGFEPIAQRARSQFQNQTVPTLAERFNSTGGALSSPAFASQLGQAGAGLDEGLAALEAQYGQQNLGNILQLLNMGLQPQQQYYQMGPQPGFLGGLLGTTLPALGDAGLRIGAGYFTGGQQGASQVLKMLAGLL